MSERYLPGAAKYRKKSKPKRKVTPGSPLDYIQRADVVSIYDVLRDFLHLDVPQGGKSYKVRCPFYLEHGDGGLDKGFRVYGESNSSYCFIMHGVMGPVRLVAYAKELRPAQAAEAILREYDLLRPRRYDLRFAELAAERARNDVAKTTPSYAVEALQTALSRDERYAARQFDEDFLDAMDEQMEALDNALEIEQTEPTAVQEWFNTAKETLSRYL